MAHTVQGPTSCHNINGGQVRLLVFAEQLRILHEPSPNLGLYNGRAHACVLNETAQSLP